MNLKKYTRADCKMIPKGHATLRIAKAGTFTLNKLAVQAIDLKIGDTIAIHQDEDSPIDWYIEKTSDKMGFVLRKQTAGGLVMNAQPIAKKVLESVNKQGISTSFRIATTPIEEKYYAIITRSAK